MRVVFTGGRKYNNAKLVSEVLTKLNPTYVYVGDATGLDSIVRYLCQIGNITHKVFKADWDKFGDAAGPIRNGEMLDYANGGEGGAFLVAFPGNKGTKNCIAQAKERNMLVLKVEEQ